MLSLDLIKRSSANDTRTRATIAGNKASSVGPDEAPVDLNGTPDQIAIKDSGPSAGCRRRIRRGRVRVEPILPLAYARELITPH